MMRLIIIGCLLSLLIFLPTTFHFELSAAPPREKQDFWRSLLSVAMGGQQDELAERLTLWPNQRKAALFYLELIAQLRASQVKEAPSSNLNPSEKWSWSCQRASLAELEFQPSSLKNSIQLKEEPEDNFHFTSSASSPIKRLKLAKVPAKQVLALERIQPALSKASRLVLELANLVNRLAVQSASEFARNLASERDFLRFLLESKLTAAKPTSTNFNQHPHSLGIVLFRRGGVEPEWAWLSTFANKLGDDSTATILGIDLLEHPQVGWKRKHSSREESTASAIPEEATDATPQLPLNSYFEQPMHPMGVAKSNGSSTRRAWQAGQPFLLEWLDEARGEGKLMRQLEERASSGEPLRATDGHWFSPYLDCGLSQRWLFTYSVPLFARLKEDNDDDNDDEQGGDEEQGDDGKVSSSGLSSSSSSFVRFLTSSQKRVSSQDRRRRQRREAAAATAAGQLTSSLKGAKFRGVAFVTLDFEQLKLIDQCSDQQQQQQSTQAAATQDGYQASSPFFLRNTHECARLQGSQCVRLPDGGVRAGAYACQCPRGGSVAREQLDAVNEFRAQLQQQQEQEQESGQTLGGGKHHQVLSKWLFAGLSAGKPELGAIGNRARVAKQLMVAGARKSSTKRPPNIAIHHEPISLEAAAVATKANQTASRRSGHTHFALGAQLEADAALTLLLWRSRRSIDWPAQICLGCLDLSSESQVNQVNSSRSEDTKIDGSSSTASSPEESTSTTTTSECSELLLIPPEHHFAGLGNDNRNLLRPLVLLAQLLGSFCALALAALLLRLRKSRIILASGWLMLETILIGALLLYSSVLVRYFQATSITCLLEPWLRELGFSIFYGSILIKLYRILTEFQTRKAHRVCLRDKDQMIYLLAIVLIVTGYMGAWTALMLDGFFYKTAHEFQNNNAHAFESQQQQQAEEEEQQQLDSSTWLIEQADTIDSSPEGSGKFGLLGQLAEFAPSQVKLLEQSLSSFANLFSGLLEQQQYFDKETNVLTYSMRCRKLTWDYVTELSEMALLLFGIYLIYKLRNASSDSYKEKLVLSAAVFIELLVSGSAYVLKHAFWAELSAHQILLLYCLRCQLTVSPTLVLVFGPKLWTIGKSRPNLFRGGKTITGSSMRHRCHISCELHDHHLNDAVQLHQAMLSNAALDFGSINLADMDPDEIQAELKRVYAQLELLKTKVMRKDNPHISKRRGGRKTGHRKFSLQAFHAKHLGGGHHHHDPSSKQPAAGRGGAAGSEHSTQGPSELVGLDERPEEEAALQQQIEEAST